jgi:ribonuclease HI
MITIFTDGSARGNPGPGAIVATDDMVVELGGREGHTTNNRMELQAVIAGIQFVSENVFRTGHTEEIVVHTDSAYVLNGSTRWVYGWQKNNWKTSQKDDVINRDLWGEMLEVISHKIIRWELLKGHSGIPANERCDVIATSYADENPVVLYTGSRERYGVNLVIKKDIQQTGEHKSRSKKAYSYVSKVGGVIQTHKTWEECKTRVTGVSGARYQKSVSPENEEEIIALFGSE